MHFELCYGRQGETELAHATTCCAGGVSDLTNATTCCVGWGRANLALLYLYIEQFTGVQQTETYYCPNPWGVDKYTMTQLCVSIMLHITYYSTDVTGSLSYVQHVLLKLVQKFCTYSQCIC
jgi:hypothetical protein